MAESQKTQKAETQAPAKTDQKTHRDDPEKTNPGTPSSEAYESSDTNLAEAAGISEGDVHALRDDAGLNQLAGHEMDLHAWSVSPSGKEFKDGEKDRKKKYNDEAKAYKESLTKDGLTEAEAKYREAVKKA